MKVLLFFPPQADPQHPYSSLPALKAYLNSEGYGDVVCRDLNIEAYDQWLLTPTRLERARVKAARRFEALDELPALQGEQIEEYNLLNQAVMSADYVIRHIEEAKGVLRDKTQFYDPERYLWALNTINQGLILVCAEFFPTRLKLYGFEMKYSIYSSSEVLQAVRDEAGNPFIELYKQYVLENIGAKQPDLIGISITYPQQVIPGFTLASVIRQAFPGIHITVGGAVLPELKEGLTRNKELYNLVDSFVLQEGEPALLELVRHLESNRPLGGVPNIAYLENDEIVVTGEFFFENLDCLPTPSYEGLPLHRYFSPEPVILQTLSRGCHWGKCKFCVISQATGKQYRIRDIQRVIEDIARLSKQLDTRYFFLADNSVSPRILEAFSDALLANGLDIYWECETRFEAGLTAELCRKAYKAGCRNLIFGFESASPRVLEAMGKGITPKAQEEIIGNCYNAGIGVNLQCFVGYPTETEEEARVTLDFLVENKEMISSIAFGIFSLAKDAPMFRSPAALGMTNLEKPAQNDFSTRYSYDVLRGMNKQEAVALKKSFDPALSEAFPMTFLGIGNDAHTLLLFSKYGKRVFRDIFKGPTASQDAGKGVFQWAWDSRPLLREAVKGLRVNFDLKRIQTLLAKKEPLPPVPALQGEKKYILYNGESAKNVAFNNNVGIRMLLDLLDGEHTIAAIADTLRKTFNTGLEEARKQCMDFIRYLEGIDMVTPADQTVTGGCIS